MNGERSDSLSYGLVKAYEERDRQLKAKIEDWMRKLDTVDDVGEHYWIEDVIGLMQETLAEMWPEGKDDEGERHEV
jgi:hypothetical protein